MITEYLESILGRPKDYHNTQKGLQANWDCPFCADRRQRFFVNLDRHVVWCHNCEYGATLITFISDFTHTDFKSALRTFREYEGFLKPLPQSIETEIYEKLFASEISQATNKVIYKLPDEFIPITSNGSKLSDRVYGYIKERLPWVTIEEVERRGIGFCLDGRYRNRMIFPFYENNELVYWQARTWLKTPDSAVQKKMFRKVLNPSLTEEQVKQGMQAVEKSEVIYNIDAFLEERIVVLTEGVFDSLTLGNIGGGLNGKHLSDFQLMKLIVNKDKIDVVVILLDGDAYQNAIVAANSFGRKGCLEAIKIAVPYNNLFRIRSRLLK